MSEVLDQLDVQPDEIVNHQQETQQVQPEAAQESTPEVPKEDPQEKNWRAARMRYEELRHQNQLLQQELEFVRKQQSQVSSKDEPDEEEYLTDSEKKLNQKIKSLESKLEKTLSKEQDFTIDRLRSKFTDFDEVLSLENVNFLKENNPALAKAIYSLKDDPYEQGLAAYEALKNTSWYKQKQLMEEKTKIEQNSKKPMSVQAVRKQGALSEANRFANGLTPELRKSLQQEMAQARKGV